MAVPDPRTKDPFGASLEALVETCVELGSAMTCQGDRLLLRRSGGRYEIRCNGAELMSNGSHHSEEMLARLACQGMAMPEPRVLIGGLGMGYSLRAALDGLPVGAKVTVVEALPEVVAWNRGALAALADAPLADPRVKVVCDDVAAVIGRSVACYDAIILDVDNGPGALSLQGNARLYTVPGLATIRRALAGGGRLAVWSADPSAEFERALDDAGLAWRIVAVPARGRDDDPRHSLYLAGVGAGRR